MAQVKIHRGTYRNQPITDAVFTLVDEYKQGARGGYVTVDSGGQFGPNYKNVRIRVDSKQDIELLEGQEPVSDVKTKTDEQIIARIEQRFSILDDMTKAAIAGDIRAMIVVGPPGVGKSYGVEHQLEKAGLFDKISQRKTRYEIVKGAMTSIGLYCKLYEYSDSRSVLVFDDCDSVLLDDLSLNILKAALDSSKRRRIHWNADSAVLRRERIPDSFEFKGSVIFITNLKFENLRSKKLQDHLDALQSRCHYLDLSLDTVREKILRIRQIFRKGDLFQDYDFTPAQGEEIIAFMQQNESRLREISLRMALKIADLTKVGSNWQELARNTCMKA